MFKVAHAGKVLVQPAAVARAEIALQRTGLIGDGVQDAAAGIETANLGGDFLRRTLDEELAKDFGGFFLGNARKGRETQIGADGGRVGIVVSHPFRSFFLEKPRKGWGTRCLRRVGG